MQLSLVLWLNTLVLKATLKIGEGIAAYKPFFSRKYHDQNSSQRLHRFSSFPF